MLPPPLNRSDAGGALGDTNYGVDSRGGGSSEPPTENSFAGNRLLSQAVKQLGKHRTIVAKIRHRVDLFGHELVGSGTYRQLDVGQDRLLRLELKIPLDNQMTSIQQVCDSRYLWTQQTMPDKLRGERTTISRIDLNEVRRAAFDDSFGIPSDGLLIGQGGLPQLLIELERHFAFHHVRPGTLHQVPVWIMWGEWKPSALQLLFGDSSGKSGEKRPSASRDELLARLPRHAPHCAIVILGQQDLFPYQFEYRRWKDGRISQDALSTIESADSLPIVTMELFEVQVGVSIDPIQFVFKPGDRPVINRTQDYLQRFSRNGENATLSPK